jgi:hypothetical protein
MNYPAENIPRTRSLIERMIGAAMLDVSVYEEVEHDRGATGQAAIVVAIVAVCSAIGYYNMGPEMIVLGIVSAFISWLIWAVLTYLIGTKAFGGTADVGEMLRTLGFAQAPGVLLILSFIPLLGGLIGFVAWIWTTVTAVIAIRQALDFDTGKAVLTALITIAVVIAVTFLLALMFGGMMPTGAGAGAR